MRAPSRRRGTGPVVVVVAVTMVVVRVVVVVFTPVVVVVPLCARQAVGHLDIERDALVMDGHMFAGKDLRRLPGKLLRRVPDSGSSPVEVLGH